MQQPKSPIGIGAHLSDGFKDTRDIKLRLDKDTSVAKAADADVSFSPSKMQLTSE